MFATRDLPGISLREVAAKVAPAGNNLRCSTDDIQVHLHGDEPGVRVRKGPDAVEFFPTTGAREAFATILNIPDAFLKRVSAPLAETIISGVMSDIHSEVKIGYNDDGVIREIGDANKQHISPDAACDIAQSVLGEDAPVINWWKERTDFRLDVAGGNQGLLGGDPSVGDISWGGLRYTQDLKKHLNPQVQKLIYRLVCTNGMEVADATARLDGRGDTIEEYLDSLEVNSRRLYSEVEADISSFYDLRNVKLGDASQAVLRVGSEQGIPDRMVLGLTRLVPEMIPDDASQFDLANLLTNSALDPNLKAGSARKLEQAAGGVVTEHAARCHTCAARLN